MPANEVALRSSFLLPPEVLDLFGEAPLLAGEDDGPYYVLLEEFTKLIAPKDMIEWWWVKDWTDHTFEIRRLRRFKAICVDMQRDQTIPSIRAMSYSPGPEVSAEKRSAWFFLDVLRPYMNIDKLIASAESRRSRTLREIERRRADLARRLREASDEDSTPESSKATA
jgi:hypothetical protein